MTPDPPVQPVPEEPAYTFSVVTATYNRAHLLPRTYESLEAQTFRDFEWLVVDDGSTDGTDSLVREWTRESSFPIRYLSQEQGGKHLALNHAASVARGRFLASVDSDDWYLPTTLERFLATWESIDPGIRDSFVGVVGLCSDPDGHVIGDTFPEPVLDATYTELRETYRVTGDNVGCARTDVIRRFPYPVIPGERLYIEIIVLDRISREYRARCVNEVLQVVDYQADGMSTGRRGQFVGNPKTAALYFREQCSRPGLSTKARAHAHANHTRYAMHAGTFRTSLRESGSAMWWLATLPLALGAYARDRATVGDGT